jgi:hypothetical protein
MRMDGDDRTSRNAGNTSSKLSFYECGFKVKLMLYNYWIITGVYSDDQMVNSHT